MCYGGCECRRCNPEDEPVVGKSAWTTERPTRAGLFYKRKQGERFECVMVSHEHETSALIWSNFATEWDWVNRPDVSYEWQPVAEPEA